MSALARAVLVCSAAWILADPGFPQSPTAMLVGHVVDPSGAGIPGATVTLRNTNTGEERTVTVGETAEFTLPNLPPGRYRILVEREGFKRLVQQDLDLEVEQVARITLRMELGSISESVEVEATVPVLNTENASRGDVIVSQEVTEMPLEGREFLDLAYLIPGVSRKAEGGSGSNLSINGARADNSNFIVDGFNSQNPRAGAIQARPPIDALQEFKVQVSGYSAEHGRLAGGVVNMALKTGGNRLHGTFFEFLRNDRLDARDFFDAEKHKLRRNQFGSTLHGPVSLPRLYDGRNRTFFLASWESYRQSRGERQLGRVPTALERQGDFSQSTDAQGQALALKDPFSTDPCGATGRSGCFADNRIPSHLLHPVALQMVTFYPLPDRPQQANNYLASATDRDNWDSWLVKLDHALPRHQNLSFRLLQRLNRTSQPFAGSTTGSFGNSHNATQTLTGLSLVSLFRPTLINEARIGLNRTSTLTTSATIGDDYAGRFGISGVTTDPRLMGFPRVTIRDLFDLGPPANTPVEFTVNNYEWSDTLSWVRAPHLIKFGFHILRTQFFQPYNENMRGTLNFLGRWTNDPMADFLLGLLNNSSRQVTQIRNYLFSTSYGVFVQDDWKAAGNLTVNLGVRYEISKPPLEKYDRWANFVPELGQIVLADDRTVTGLEALLEQTGLTGRVTVARQMGLPRSLADTNYGNVAPRLGLAWRPRGGTRSVIRAGYGVFFGASLLNPLREDMGNVFPFAISQSFQRNANQVGQLTLSNPFPEARARLDGVYNSAGRQLYPSPQYLQSWNLTVERELRGGAALEAGYVGSKGTHLARRYNLN